MTCQREQPSRWRGRFFPAFSTASVYGLVSTGLFIDIGIPDDFKRAQTLLTSRIGTASHDSSALISRGIPGDTT